VETFRRNMGIELIHVDAGDRFFERLAGVVDPEEKRKTIGELFVRSSRRTPAVSPTPSTSCRARSIRT
jgi:GMP synthase (glutamine-hydrolysing)